MFTLLLLLCVIASGGSKLGIAGLSQASKAFMVSCLPYTICFVNEHGLDRSGDVAYHRVEERFPIIDAFKLLPLAESGKVLTRQFFYRLR